VPLSRIQERFHIRTDERSDRDEVDDRPGPAVS